MGWGGAGGISLLRINPVLTNLTKPKWSRAETVMAGTLSEGYHGSPCDNTKL